MPYQCQDPKIIKKKYKKVENGKVLFSREKLFFDFLFEIKCKKNIKKLIKWWESGLENIAIGNEVME